MFFNTVVQITDASQDKQELVHAVEQKRLIGELFLRKPYHKMPFQNALSLNILRQS